VTLSQVSTQPFFQVRPHSEHSFSAVAEMKIFHPASNALVDSPDEVIQRDTSHHSCGHPRDLALHRLQGFLGWLNVGVALARATSPSYTDLESEKVEHLLSGIEHTGLFLIQVEVHPSQNLLQYRHRPLGSTPTQNDDIVRIADHACAEFLLQLPPLPYPIHQMQIPISQQRGNYSTNAKDNLIFPGLLVVLIRDLIP
jgi:hypothetical protein